MIQIIWFIVEVLARICLGYQSTVLEIMTAAFVFCPVLSYGFSWNRPQNVEHPILIELGTAAINGNKSNGISQTEIHKTPTPTIDLDTHRGLWIALLLGLVGSAFGAIHCLAWNSRCPTLAERWIWRTSSVITTSLPPFIFLNVLLVDYCDWRFWDSCSNIIVSPTMGVYAIARLIIIVLGFISLRALPANAYQTVD